jgi:2-polyprenyl-3-methyl-5-hydroxy-6-metoxy-1,4-benzoquinol methylase
MPDEIDWQDQGSIWHARPGKHHLRPDGSGYPRYLFVKRQIAQGSRVLDVGCGAGTLAENLSLELGCEVCGVDVVPQFVWMCNTSLVERLRREGLRTGWFVCADFSTMTADQVYSLGTFDVVTALEVIEHPVDVRSFRRNVNLALRPYGKLIVTTPHPDSPRYGYGYMHSHAHHIRMWSKWRLEQVFGPMLEYEKITTSGEHIGAVWGKA